MIESQLLSKIIDDNSFYTLQKYNIKQDDFESHGAAYEFVKDYVKQYGHTPDYRTVVSEVETFEYTAEVTDNVVYLCKTLKSHSAKRKAVLRLAQVNDKFQNMNGLEFATWLKDEATALESVANAAGSTVTNYATNGEERKEWYEENKDTRTLTYIPTPYPSLTKWLGGGFSLSDYTLLLAFTNVGKSWIGSHIGNVAHENGFAVLHYSPELSKKQQVYRNDTLRGHFDNTKIRRGTLDNEEQYYKFLEKFNEENEVPYYIKTMEDLPNGLSCDVIEADLQMYDNIGMVIIDGFNLMTHQKIGRDGMTATSRRLRQIFGRYNVSGVVIHQTTGASGKEMKGDMEELDTEIVTPKITDYSETIATIQDAATVLTFNQNQGRGKLLLAKCREPYVDHAVDLRCNFNMGYITEAQPVDYF